MTEGDGYLIASATRGLGYQLAGAFRRLGRRTATLITPQESTSELDQLPMKTQSVDWQNPQAPLTFTMASEFSAVFFTPHPELSLNRPVSDLQVDAMIRLLTSLRERQPRIHALFVLPLATPAEKIARLRQSYSRCTIFLSPALFGFKDAGLMDTATQLLSEQSSELLRDVSHLGTPPGGLAFVGDVAALLVSATENERCLGMVYQIPTLAVSLEQWRLSFVEHFAPSMPWLQRWTARLTGAVPTWARTASQMAIAPASNHTELHNFVPAQQITEHFPTAWTPLARALRTAADQFRRNPGMDLVFPPARSL